VSAPPATSCAAARLRNRDNHVSPAESSIAIRIPRNSSVQIRYVPFRRHARAQTWALPPWPAAGSTNSPAHSLFEAGKFGWGCTRRILRCKPVEQTTSAASSAGPLRIFRHSTASPDASPSARGSLSRRQRPPFFQRHLHRVNPVRSGFRAGKTRSVAPIRRDNVDNHVPIHNRNSSTIHAWSTFTCPLLCQQSPSGFSTTRSDTGVPRGTPRPLLQRGRQPPHPSFVRQLRHRRHNLRPLIAIQPLQSPAFIATKSGRHHHFDRPAPLKPQVVDC